MTDLNFNQLFVIYILQNDWSVKVKWHFSAFFSLFVPLSIHILIEQVFQMPRVRTVVLFTVFFCFSAFAI